MDIYLKSRQVIRQTLTWLRDNVVAERARWVLWLPVALGAGIGIYFGLPFEPPQLLGVAGLAISFGLIIVCHHIWPARLGFLAVMVFFLGFAAAQWRTQDVAATVLNRALASSTVEGDVQTVEPSQKGPRVVLEVRGISGLSAEETPKRVRLRLRVADAGTRPGDRIRVHARLAPPPSASYPGSFDFSRQAWFAGLGAVGFAFGPAEILTREDPSRTKGHVRQSIEGWRAKIADRITARIGGPAGGVAAALATGLRGEIPEDVRQQMRDSGLAHLLAISGLHIGLVAGFVFTLVRGGLALWPGLALRWPLKKIAAVVALLAAAVYMLLAGATIPTQRAFIMTGVVLVAMLLNRTGISLRLIAFAASLVLLARPEALLSVSFQMSFSAAIALVAAYEVFAGRFRVVSGESSVLRRAGMYFVAVAFTTLIASLATAPFAVFHFNRLALLGMAANLAAVPIAALWVMPLEVLVLLLMPLGLEGWVTPSLAWGVSAILWVAATVSAWPLAAITLPGPGTAGLLLVVLGGLWLALWQRRWRLAGVVAVVAGLVGTGPAHLPDVLIAEEARLVAFRSDSGALNLSNSRAQPFVRYVWLRRTGIDNTREFPQPGAENEALRCDGQSCVGQIGAHRIAFVTDPLAFEEDCRNADIIVADIPAPPSCQGPRLVIDWFYLWRGGAHAIWLGQGAAPANIWRARVELPTRPWMRSATR